jgi:hypothetical protein
MVEVADFGKKIQDQLLEPTRFLDQPPRVLRAAMNGLKSRHEFKGGHRLKEAINKVLEKNPHLSEKYGCPDPRSDRLYKATFIHRRDKEASCAKVCGSDLSNLEDRRPRNNKEGSIVIYYGLITSGNELMKDT